MIDEKTNYMHKTRIVSLPRVTYREENERELREKLISEKKKDNRRDGDPTRTHFLWTSRTEI